VDFTAFARAPLSGKGPHSMKVGVLSLAPLEVV
jgi:hypothetical protein